MAAAYSAILSEAEAGIDLIGSAYKTVQKGMSTLSSIVTPLTQKPESRKRQATEAAKAIAHQQGAVYDPLISSMVPAQVIHGRGAELPFSSMNYAKPIKFKTGELAGPSYQDPWVHFAKLFKSNMNVSMGFAFKMILPFPTSNMNSTAGVYIPPASRFVVHNIFRHNLSRTTNTSSSGLFGTTVSSWNQTLGPDGSFVRLNASDVASPSTGTSYAAPPVSAGGLNSNYNSPYRYPLNNGFMYSRLNRQTLENLGWNANPIKLANIKPFSNTLATTQLEVFGNGTIETAASPDTASLPSQAVIDQGTGVTGSTTPWRYRSQMGRGGVTYHFHNDGTNPVVVDVVITRVKKGETWQVYTGSSALFDAYNQGYNNYITNNRGQVNLAGQPPSANDCLTNSRIPFMPEIALKWYKNPGAGTHSPHPFKQVGRDQFMLPSGGSRVWSMDLQALSYNAFDYDQNTHGFDDISYCISIGVSGAAVSIIEQNTSITNPPVVDRRGDACNVSVQGAYNEKPFPVYPIMTNSKTFINGVCDTPFYGGTIPGTQSNPAIDIASVAQATRGNANSSAFIVLGPTSTLTGGA